VRVTHPFHPLSGQQLVCVGERCNRYGTRLLLRVDENHVCSVPRQWTDVVAPDPEVVLGEGRAVLRVVDLLELADLVSRLVEQERRAQLCKGNNAANVRQNVPHHDRRQGDKTREGDMFRPTLAANALEGGHKSGVIVVTAKTEVPCRDEATGQTPRAPRSSKTAR
jgi:hypothetical protein